MKTMLKQLWKKVYFVWFWVEDSTPGIQIWFSENNKIVPLDYPAKSSSTALLKKWKSVYALVDDMKEFGSKAILVTKVTYIFGKQFVREYRVGEESNE